MAPEVKPALVMPVTASEGIHEMLVTAASMRISSITSPGALHYGKAPHGVAVSVFGRIAGKRRPAAAG